MTGFCYRNLTFLINYHIERFVVKPVIAKIMRGNYNKNFMLCVNNGIEAVMVLRKSGGLSIYVYNFQVTYI